MNNYKINCVGMTDEQKRIVQDAFFKLGYDYHANGVDYFIAEYYFAYSNTDLTHMLGEDVEYFENKTHPEITFNELMKLANMEEYMTFTKADLKTGMIIEFMDGQIAQVLLGTSNGDIVTGDDWFPLKDRTDEDLFKLSGSSSIKMVYQPKSNKFFSLVGAKRDGLSKYEYNIVWERPEPISAQQQAIRDGIVALEAKQQELIDQAEKIKADIAKLKGM